MKSLGLHLSRRAKLACLGIFLLALPIFFPMRLALSVAGLDKFGISAKGADGIIWSGTISSLNVGNTRLGGVYAGLSPFHLFVGTARLDLWRHVGQPDDFSGAISAGLFSHGADDVTGSFPIGAAFAPMPISGVDFTDFTVHFAGSACSHAQGRVRARIAGQIGGINLAQGLSGEASCEGDKLLLPLASQSAMEKLRVVLDGDGNYDAEMTISNADPSMAQSLGEAGFAPVPGGYVLRVKGQL